jgi:hypothetical protein
MQFTILSLQSKISRLICAAALVATACGSGGGLFRQYEYDEEIYLSLDGSASVYVNTSLAALNALRGTSFNTSPTAPVDREKLREMYTTPITHVARTPALSRRSGRRFVHVRIDVADIRKLGEAAPFAWSKYELARDGDLYLFRQRIGPSAAKDVGNVGWTGQEMVAFRLHLPSEIVYHNAGPGNPKRGNILAWEQPLADRLRGRPLVPDPDPALDARMKTQSILYSTLKLFGATVGLVAVMFALVIWWILRRAPPIQSPAGGTRT